MTASRFAIKKRSLRAFRVRLSRPTLRRPRKRNRQIPRSSQMAYETLVAVYDTPDHADAAVKALKAAGFAESDISIFDSARLKGGKVTMSSGVRETGLWHRLFGTDVYEHEADIYGQTIEDGGV